MGGSDDDADKGKVDAEGNPIEEDDTEDHELDADGNPVLGADGKPVAKKKETPAPTLAEVAKATALELNKIQKEEAETARKEKEAKEKKTSQATGDTKLDEMRARLEEIEGDAFSDPEIFKEVQKLNRDIAKAEAKAEMVAEFGPRMEFADDLAARETVSAVLAPLEEGEQKAAIEYIKEKNLSPKDLANPIVADLVQSKARLVNFEKTGVLAERPIPGATGTRGKPSTDTSLQSGDEKNIVQGFEKVAERLNASQAKGAKPIKLDRGEMTGRRN
jgi:hypothetical protein